MVDRRIGTAAYDEVLRLRGLDLSAAEVLDIARALAEEAFVERSRTMRRRYAGKSPHEAVREARQTAPQHRAEALTWARELLGKSQAFCLENGVVPFPTVDGETTQALPGKLHVDVLPACLATQGIPARYFAPQPYAPRPDALLLMREGEPQTEGFSELSVFDLEGYIASLAVPGAHVLSSWTAITSSMARRGPISEAGSIAATWGQDLVEGWALTAHEWARERHFRASAAGRLMMIDQQINAALRAVVDVGLHAGALTPEGAVNLLVRRGGLRLPTARAQVRSILRTPTSGVSAVVGKVRIEQLRREAYRRWRGTFTHTRFFSLLFGHGPVPLAYLFEHIDSTRRFGSEAETSPH
jgi:Bacterial protein of unknown function (DUF885)